MVSTGYWRAHYLGLAWLLGRRGRWLGPSAHKDTKHTSRTYDALSSQCCTEQWISWGCSLWCTRLSGCIRRRFGTCCILRLKGNRLALLHRICIRSSAWRSLKRMRRCSSLHYRLGWMAGWCQAPWGSRVWWKSARWYRLSAGIRPLESWSVPNSWAVTWLGPPWYNSKWRRNLLKWLQASSTPFSFHPVVKERLGKESQKE